MAFGSARTIRPLTNSPTRDHTERSNPGGRATGVQVPVAQVPVAQVISRTTSRADCEPPPPKVLLTFTLGSLHVNHTLPLG